MVVLSDVRMKPEIVAHVEALKSTYWSAGVSAAHHLCDKHHPQRLAYQIVHGDLSAQSLTYGDLKSGSSQVAHALQNLGVQPGDRVATLMGKGRNYLNTILGIWRLGAVHVPLFTAFAVPQIAFRLTGSKAKVIVCDEIQVAKLRTEQASELPAGLKVITTGEPEGAELKFEDVIQSQSTDFKAFVGGPDHPVVQLYTSGTTGTPKGVVMPIKSFASFHAYMDFGMDIRDSDVFWGGADPGWAYGLFTSIFGSMLTGVHSILYAGGFSPEKTYGTLAKYAVTNYTAAPTVYRALKASGLPVPAGLKLRCASSAGEPLTPDVNAWADQALGVKVHDHYGQTEMGMMVGNHHNTNLKTALKEGSMGLSTPGFTAVILKSDSDALATINTTGRLAIDLAESPLAWFEGYADLPEKTAEKMTADGRYYITGDVAEMDEDDFVHFSSRDDDIIIMAGYRIGPFEIESTLSKHAAVSESAAVARKDEVRGEVLEAFVVLDSAATASEDLTKELQAHVKTTFAAHAYPRRIHYVDTLPKTPSGKVQRFLLRKQLENEAV